MSYNYALRPGTSQKVSFTASSVPCSNAFGTQTRFVKECGAFWNQASNLFYPRSSKKRQHN